MNQEILDFAINKLGFTTERMPYVFGGPVYWHKYYLNKNKSVFLEQEGSLYLVVRVPSGVDRTFICNIDSIEKLEKEINKLNKKWKSKEISKS